MKITADQFSERIEQHQQDIYAGQIDGERLNFDSTDYSEVRDDLINQMLLTCEISEEEAETLSMKGELA